MTENDSTSGSVAASAPKKLKLTLKLNSSSTTTTPASSQLNSSTTTSPVKPVVAQETSSVPVVVLSELPSGLGNLKGRGRPKKAAASKTDPVTMTENNTAATTATSTAAAATPNEYAADLKSFVTSMKTFKCRNWSLKRPLSLETKNVAGYDVNLTSGLWCTFTSELGSAHLRNIDTTVTSDAVVAPFEVTCQCGKVFNNQSKYKKHLKIHEKASPETSENPTNLPSSQPTLSLKIKLNTK